MEDEPPKALVVDWVPNALAGDWVPKAEAPKAGVELEPVFAANAVLVVGVPNAEGTEGWLPNAELTC